MKRVVPAALAAAGFVAGLFPIFDGDLFWHLASGRWIVAHGSVPRADPFRFGAEGLPWVDHEWLFQVVLYALERSVGLDGIIALRAAALAGFGLLLYAVARRGTLTPGLAGLVGLAAVLGVRPRFLDRPEIVTLFFVVLLLSLLERRELGRGARPALDRKETDRVAGRGEDSGVSSEEMERGDSARVGGPALFGLVTLVVVWVNLHGEALLAPGLAGLFLLGAALEEPGSALESVRSRWREIVGIPLLLALALLGNPYGWRLVEVPLGIRGALADLGAVNPEWLSAFRAPQPYLFGGVAVVAALGFAARRERGRWVGLEWGLPALALAALALSAVRHQALFYAAGAPFAARSLAALGEVRRLGRRSERRWAFGAVAIAVTAAVWAAFPPASGPLRPRHGGLSLGIGLAEGRFPVRAVERLAGRDDIGPLYNEFAHGGYLLWRLHPPRQVFLDGRMELEPSLLHELVAARRSPEAWRNLLVARGATGALVRYETRPVPVVEPDGRGGFRVVETRTANAYLFPRRLWDLVDWDDETMLFVPTDAEVAGFTPYRSVEPEDVAWMLRRAATDEGYRRAASVEIERKLAEQPDCRRAAWLLDQMRGLSAKPSG